MFRSFIYIYKHNFKLILARKPTSWEIHYDGKLWILVVELLPSVCSVSSRSYFAVDFSHEPESRSPRRQTVRLMYTQKERNIPVLPLKFESYEFLSISICSEIYFDIMTRLCTMLKHAFPWCVCSIHGYRVSPWVLRYLRGLILFILFVGSILQFFWKAILGRCMGCKRVVHEDRWALRNACRSVNEQTSARFTHEMESELIMVDKW